MNIHDFKEYCNKDLLPTDISYLKDANGNPNTDNPFIGIDAMKLKLDGLMDIGIIWGTENFTYTIIGELITAKISLNLGFKKLEGGSAVNWLQLQKDGFDNFVGTVKSMAICNAARDLGKFFGGELYKKENTETDHEGVPIVQLDKGVEIDIEYENLKEELRCSNKAYADFRLKDSKYSDVLELINIVKKLKYT